MIASGTASRRARFFRELATLSKAGIPMKSAADLLGRKWRERRVRAAMATLTAGLDRGETIAQALAPDLNALESGIVAAAEQAGRLEAGFRHLEEYYQLLAKSGAAIRTALAYPVVMLHFGVIIPAMLAAVLEGRSALPAIASALVKLYVFLALVWLLWRGIRKVAERSVAIDRVLRRVPLVGPARWSLALTRWNAVMHFHLSSGARISGALRDAGAATLSAALHAASLRAASLVEGGSTLGDAIQGEDAFPYELVSSLATAECAGSLDVETARQAGESNSMAALRLQRLTEWLPRLFYFAVIAFMVYQIFRVASGYLDTQVRLMNELGL